MFKDFIGWVDDIIIKMGVYLIIYIDVLWYYGFESVGKKVVSIDEIFFDDCIGFGVVFDMMYKEDGDVIIVVDMDVLVEKLGVIVDVGIIVFIYMGWDKFFGIKEYW